MSEDIHRKYTPEQTARMREETVARIARSVGRVFAQHPELRSALMLVAQYWNDEAEDAVHCKFIFSKLATPDLEAAHRAWVADKPEDPINLPKGLSHVNLTWDVKDYGWDSNGDAIALFAAFTREGCHQEMLPTESGAPHAVFRRSAQGVATERVGEMLRPWLDGVRPEWDLTPR